MATVGKKVHFQELFNRCREQRPMQWNIPGFILTKVNRKLSEAIERIICTVRDGSIKEV